jgi:hypothetical protein
MAEIVKPKDLAKILENIPENQIANAAQELGVKPEQLTKFVSKPTGKAFEKIAKTLGEGIEGAQKFVDKFRQQAVTEVSPSATKMEVPTTQVTGPEVVTPKAPFASEEAQPFGRMTNLQSKLKDATVSLDKTPRFDLGITKQPEVPPPAMSQTPTQQAMEAAIAPKQPQMTKAPVKRAAAAALAGIGASFSQTANPPPTIAAAQVDKIEDVQDLADKAEAQGAVTPEQKAVFVEQAQQVVKAQKSLEQILREEYKQDKARVELMQLTETIMNGLVTAIGANALLNRGSPYAVDFSKGPKTDWAGEFDRLQKDFKTQMDALNEKYKLEAQEKREAEREARRKYEFEETQKLSREKLEAQKAKEAEAAALKTEEKEQKAQSDIRASIGVIQDETAAPGRILTEKKNLIRLGNTKLGESAIQELLTQATNSVEGGRSLARRGKLLVKDFFNMDIGLNVEEQQAVTKKFAELLEQKLDKQGRPAAPAPAAAPSDADAKRRRLEELRAKKSGG